MNVDSHLVLDLLDQGVISNYQLRGLILQCQALMRRAWSIRLVHCFQKANSAILLILLFMCLIVVIYLTLRLERFFNFFLNFLYRDGEGIG